MPKTNKKKTTATTAEFATTAAKSLASLRKECSQILASILVLSHKEVQERVAKIQLLPKEGLQKLLITLKLAAFQQHYYFEILTQNDFLFPLKLKMILNKNKLIEPKHE